MTAQIYCVTNTINGKRYVGFTTQTLCRRWTQHKSGANRRSSRPLIRAIRRYGSENFKIESLYSGDDPNYTLTVMEPLFIATLRPEYNATVGGDGILGYTHTKRTRRQISDMQRGRKLTEIHKQRISAGNVGKTWTESSLRKHKVRLGVSIIVEGTKFLSMNDAAAYLGTKYKIPRNTALRHMRKGVTNFSKLAEKYTTSPVPYSPKKYAYTNV